MLKKINFSYGLCTVLRVKSTQRQLTLPIPDQIAAEQRRGEVCQLRTHALHPSCRPDLTATVIR
jgi:hypothetical protein